MVSVETFSIEGQDAGDAFVSRAFSENLSLLLGATDGMSVHDASDVETAATHVLSGRVLREGIAVSVEAELRDARSGDSVAIDRIVSATGDLSQVADCLARDVATRLGAGTLEPASAIAELERLRFVWRGDEFEAALLERLGKLYADRGDYRAALIALRQAASHFPGSERAEAAARQMRRLFASLYLSEKRASLPPLARFSLR